MNKFVQYSAILAATIVAVQCIKWQECGSKEAKVTNVKVTGCDSTPICQLKKGQNYNFTVDFKTNQAVPKATAVVHGILSGIPVPFPIDNPDGCKNSGLTCPLKKGETDSYSSVLYIKKEYPKVQVIVKWELKDGNNEIFCIEVGVEIVDGDKSSKSNNHMDSTLRFKPHH